MSNSSYQEKRKVLQKMLIFDVESKGNQALDAKSAKNHKKMSTAGFPGPESFI